MRVALNGLFLEAPATGTGQYLRSLVPALRALAPQDEFVLVAPRADDTAGTVVVRPTRLKIANAAKVEFEQVTFPRACAAGGFTLAHVPHFGPPLAPPVPTVVTIHDLIPMILKAYRGSAAVRFYTQLAARGARRAHAVLTDSHASACDIETRLGIPRERVHVVYLAADERFSPPSGAEVSRVRARFGLPERFVLYLGGYDVRKNVEQALGAFAACEAERRAGWKLVLAGELPERSTAFFPDPRQSDAARQVGADLMCTGFVDEQDKPGLYGAARALVYPSRYEGFGLPPLEAMASGTPVLAANTTSLPEVVGEAGILLDPDDTRAWATALAQVINLDQLWSVQREAGLRRASAFSWARTARETLAVYHQVAQGE